METATNWNELPLRTAANWGRRGAGAATNCRGGMEYHHGRINSKAKDITTKEEGKVIIQFSQRFITVKTI
jgi:hypothetical protein